MSGLIVACFKQRLAQVGTCLAVGRGVCSTTPAFLASSRLHREQHFPVCGLRQVGTSGQVGSKALVARRRRTFNSPEQEYEEMVEECSGVKDKMEEMQIAATGKTLITVPVHLEKRLERRIDRESSNYAIRQKIINDSRQGTKAQIIINCKRRQFNHYLGQSYSRKEEVPLASGKWRHRKSKGDFFTLFPGFKREAPFYMTGSDVLSFSDLGLCEQLCENLKHLGVETPTSIQAFAIPQLLKKGGYNIVAAETGCGKTLAYLLPIMHSILEDRRYKARQQPGHPSVVILVPSRELADQVYNVAKDLAYRLDISVKLLQGGSLGSKLSNPPQKQIFDVLVATTNALKVLMDANVYGMGKISHVVLDEADTLLDDSFFPELVGPFLNRLPWRDAQRQLQLTLVSATMPRGIQALLGPMMKTEDFYTCSTPGLHCSLPHVPQKFLRMRKSHKPDKIKELVEADIKNKIPVLIFCNKSKTCDWLATYLNDLGIDCAAVHGRMPLRYRKGRIDMYQYGEIDVLIATDLASRGIDTVRTQHVINYEFPLHVADYIHRCGRTGRVGSARKCQVTNFIARLGEVGAVQQIELSVRKEKPLPEVNANIKRLFGQWYGEYMEIQPIKDGDDDSKGPIASDNEDDEFDGDTSDNSLESR